MITARNFWFWFGGIWLGVGLIFLTVGGGLGWHQSRTEADLDARGATAEGIVLAKEISTADGNRSYGVEFRFSPGEGEIRASARVDSATWEALVERGPILVTYLADDPSVHRIAGERRDEAVVAVVFGLLGALLAGVGGFLLASAARRQRRRAALERAGTRATATVVEIAPGSLRINGVPQWRLRYEFRDSHGRVRRGACSLSPEEARDLRPGAAGRVLYDPRDPRAHVWAGER